MIRITDGVLTWAQLFDRLSENGSIVCELLLQESDLTAGGTDRDLIILSEFIFDELLQHLSGSSEARYVHVKIIDVEEDSTTTIQWYWPSWACEWCGRTPTCCGELYFLAASSFD
jgi:hypothetical protein